MGDVSFSVAEMETKGKKLLDHGNFRDAKKIFDRILDNDPDNLFALDKTGVIFARQGRLDDAEHLFRKVLYIDLRYKTAWNNLGNVLLQKGENEQAKICYLKAIEIDENYAQVYHNLAAAYKKEGDIASYLKNLKKSARLEKHELGRKMVRWFKKI
jgi:tetratricopeptide (TPR) repeat protein